MAARPSSSKLRTTGTRWCSIPRRWTAIWKYSGYPIAKIRVSADVPVAQIAVRLTEVTPEGKSWLVTYNVLNLTRRDSMEQPTAARAGQSSTMSNCRCT